MINILVADSQYLIREGLRKIISDTEGLKIIGEAKNLDELEIHLTKFKPGLMLLIDYIDTAFPEEKLVASLAQNDKIKSLAITPFQSKTILLKGLELGISSFLLKSCEKDEIIDAIFSTSKNENFFCGHILENILDISEYETDLISEVRACCEPVKLSSRELEIIKQISHGFTNKEIGENLFISSHTVVTHRKNIMKKLGINNTAELVHYAFKENIIKAED